MFDDDMAVQGKMIQTLLWGTVVAENERPTGEAGYGRFVPRLGAKGER